MGFVQSAAHVEVVPITLGGIPSIGRGREVTMAEEVFTVLLDPSVESLPLDAAALRGPLPRLVRPLVFDLSMDPATCKGNGGFCSSGSTPWRITLCTDDRIVFLHEIGHAWSKHTLTPSEQVEYVDFRGLESWNDAETPWRARGSEDAANTLAWGLLDHAIEGMTPDGPLAQRNEAFRLLTGLDSPRLQRDGTHPHMAGRSRVDTKSA